MSILQRVLIVMFALSMSACVHHEKAESATESAAEKSHDHQHEHGHDHAHGHDHTPHMGIMVPFGTMTDPVGFLELKLHDDKGDLELWLTQDADGKEPYDLPLDSTITVSFIDLPQKAVELSVRNKEKNEDENGKANIRDGQTNYFIFPGDTKEDASFLMGKDFTADVVVSFSHAGNEYMSVPFVLQPHTH